MKKARASQLAYEYGDHGKKVLLTSDQYELGILTLAPDGESGVHLNRTGEILLAYVSDGMGTIRINDSFIAIEAGDAVAVEPEELYNIIAHESMTIVFSRHIPPAK